MHPDIHEHGYWTARTSYDFDLGLADALYGIFWPGLSVLDVGCGDAQYVHHLRKRGINAYGVDGCMKAVEGKDHAGWADLAVEMDVGARDWVLSLEVGEHIPHQFEDVFLDNIDRHCRRGVVLSWAVPGQGGHGHFNERDNEWVWNKMADRGYWIDRAEQNRLRKAATFSYFKNSLMVYRKFV